MGVDVTRDGHVAVVVLDRPEKRNAFDGGQTSALDAALNEVDDDPSVWVILLGSSHKVFSAGTDLAVGSGGPTGRGGHYGVTNRQRRTPLIAVVEGAAVGGGFEVVLACDLVVASTDATFALPEVSRGVIATCGALFRGPRALPPMVATEMLLTGDPLDAHRAHALGLVNRLCSPGEALAEAQRLAARICQNSPTAVGLTLRALNASSTAMDQLGWAVTADATRAVLSSPDAPEGRRAFLQRRDPAWADPS